MDKKILIILLILFTVTISGCTFKTESDNTFGQKPNATNNDLYIANSTGDHYDRNGTQYYYVWGYVGNNAGNQAPNVQITVKFYSENGTLIGTNTTAPNKPKIIPPEGQSYYYAGFKDPNKTITKYTISLAMNSK
ncbi:MAG: FxLYD domain-containing protein [Methanobacteriaceae archaeon]|nr:FxLYD domain-containing protein [Methanobacteriaceae archaeon]MDO9626622.1 FxLYD domain-containing protein [Methanobacteriaceae archaeon]